MALTLKLGRHGNSGTIEIIPRRYTRKMEQSRRQVHMRSDSILHISFSHARSTDEQGNADILLKPASLPGRQSVLANMEPIIGGIDNISII